MVVMEAKEESNRQPTDVVQNCLSMSLSSSLAHFKLTAPLLHIYFNINDQKMR